MVHQKWFGRFSWSLQSGPWAVNAYYVFQLTAYALVWCIVSATDMFEGGILEDEYGGRFVCLFLDESLSLSGASTASRHGLGKCR